MINKKGGIILLVFEILMVLIVSYSVIEIALSFARSESVAKANLAGSLSLMVNTIIASPDDALVRYPYNVSSYSFIMDSTHIVVFTPHDSDLKKQINSRFFHLPQGYTAQGVVEQKSNLCLDKKNTHLTLRECGAAEFPAVFADAHVAGKS